MPSSGRALGQTLWRSIACGGLLVLGLAQMVADLLKLDGLKGLAAMTCASPAPKVFSAVKGLETYSTRFFVEWTERDGTPRSLELTPAVYSRMRGPYNRRNVYGAALAYGPVLATNDRTRRMFHDVFARTLCGDAPLLRELGVDTAVIDGPVRVRLQPLPGTDLGDLPTLMIAPCEGSDHALDR